MKNLVIVIAIFLSSGAYAAPNLYVAAKVGAGSTKNIDNSFNGTLSVSSEENSGYTDFRTESSSVKESGVPFASIAVGTDLEFLNAKNIRVEAEYSYRDKMSLSPYTYFLHAEGMVDDEYNEEYYNVGGKLLDIDVKTQTLMLNTYYDFTTNSKFNPYVHAGLGVSRSEVALKLNMGESGVSMIDSKDTNLVWSLGAGVNYSINDKTTLDFGYRFVNFGEIEGKESRSYDDGEDYSIKLKSSSKLDVKSHDFSIGLRYKF